MAKKTDRKKSLTPEAAETPKRGPKGKYGDFIDAAMNDLPGVTEIDAVIKHVTDAMTKKKMADQIKPASLKVAVEKKLNPKGGAGSSFKRKPTGGQVTFGDLQAFIDKECDGDFKKAESMLSAMAKLGLSNPDLKEKIARYKKLYEVAGSSEKLAEFIAALGETPF